MVDSPAAIEIGRSSGRAAPSALSSARDAYRSLDAWRGIAALWVAMFHMAQVLVHRSPELRSNPFYQFSVRGDLGVQLFFVISGFCIANAALVLQNRPNGMVLFTRARLRRILPPCWYALLLAAAVSVLASTLVRGAVLADSSAAGKAILHRPLSYFLANATLTPLVFGQPLLVVQCWTLCYEVAFYLIVGVLVLGPMSRRFGPSGALAALHLLTGSILLALVVAPARVSYPLDLWPQFGLGVIVYDVVRHGVCLRSVTALGASVTLVVILVLGPDSGIGYMRTPCRVPFTTALLFALFLIVAHRFDGAILRWHTVKGFARVGVFSYSLYLTHTLSIGLVSQVMKLAHVPPTFHLVLFLVAIGGALVFGYAFYVVCERPYVGKRQRKADCKGSDALAEERAGPSPARENNEVRCVS